jgi:hypothetical protein
MNGSKVIGPFGESEADNKIISIRRRYRVFGLTPPRLEKTRILGREYMDSWVNANINKRAGVQSDASEPV